MAAAPKRGLGKGLGALIPSSTPTTVVEAAESTAQTVPAGPMGATYDELPIEQVLPNPRQPRTVFVVGSVAPG